MPAQVGVLPGSDDNTTTAATPTAAAPAVPRIGFVGDGRTPTNYLGLQRFLREGWPVLRSLSPRVKPGDWLQICYGLAWFVVPKMSALQFFPACVGSLGIVAWWTFLSCVTTLPSSGDFLADVADVAARLAMPWRESRRRAARAAACAGVHCAREALRALERGGDAGSAARTSWADLTAGMALVIPVVFLFNVVAYSSEKSVKERFVLRSALAHEHNHDVRLSLLSEDVSSMVARISAVVTRSTTSAPHPRCRTS